MLDGLGLPLIAALLEHLVRGAIGIPSRHSEADSNCLGSMASVLGSWYHWERGEGELGESEG